MYLSFSGAFRLYDVDNDGFITREEMYNIVDAMYEMVVSTPVSRRAKNSLGFVMVAIILASVIARSDFGPVVMPLKRFAAYYRDICNDRSHRANNEARSNLIGFRNYVAVPCLFEYTPMIIIRRRVTLYSSMVGMPMNFVVRTDELTITTRVQLVQTFPVSCVILSLIHI